jgi:hypothetical protein
MRFKVLVVALLCLLPSVVGAQSINYYPAAGGSDASSLTSPMVWDDFISGHTNTGTVGQLGWGPSNATATLTGAANRPGIVTTTLAATTTGALIASSNYNIPLSTVSDAVFIAAFPTAANVPDCRVGLFSTSGAAVPNDDAVYFERLAADTNWFAVTRNGADPNFTRIDTGVAFSAGTYISFEINHPAANVWQFLINGASVATAAATLPAETTLSIPMFGLTTNGTAAAISVDYFKMSLTTTR